MELLSHPRWLGPARVPRCPSRAPGAPSRLRVDYAATEISVSAGTRLEVLEERSQWVRARTRDGRVGWLPAAHVRSISRAPDEGSATPPGSPLLRGFVVT